MSRQLSLHPLSALLIAAASLALAVPAAADDNARLVRKLATRNAEKIASQLADQGKEALPAIKDGLAHRNWKIRYWAAYAMAYSKAAKDSGGVEALRPLLQDKRRRVQLRAAMAMAHLGDKSGLEKAKAHAKSGKAHLRAEAMAALAASGDAEVVPLFKEALNDGNAKVRYWALLGLRDLGGEGALELGFKYAKDRNAEVQTAALEIVGAHGKGKPETQEVLIGLLASRAALVRQQACSVLARIGTTKAIVALRKVRDKDRNQAVRDVADAAVVEILKRK